MRELVYAEHPGIRLKMPLKTEFLPVLLAVVEGGIASFGGGSALGNPLILAAEEIFGYLCRLAGLDDEVEIHLQNGRYYIGLDMVMSDLDLPWEAFNFTRPRGMPGDSGMEEMGLLIAARFLDGLKVERLSESSIALHLVKDRIYPQAVAGDFPEPELRPPFALKSPGPEESKMLAGLILRRYAGDQIPAFARFPGRLADMIASPDYSASVMTDSLGNVAGGILWRDVTERLTEFFGPYVCQGQAQTATALVEHYLASIARTPVLATYSRWANPDLPPSFFEELGSHRGAQGRLTRPVQRLLHEDNGHIAWVHPVIEDYVTEYFQEMDLPRQIHSVKNRGECVLGRTALLSRLDRQGREAVISPLRAGSGAPAALREYVDTLLEHSFVRLFFELDLGEAEYAELAPALLECGFQPLHILPYGARGDLLVLQHGTADEI